MHHRDRSVVSLMLAIAWLMHPATLSLAVAQAPPLRGTVSMVVTSLALVVGAEWGKGVLTLADGTPGGIAIREIFDEVLAIRGDDADECFRPAIWASDNGMIVVVFDVNDTITKKDFLPIHVSGIVAKIRRWLMSR